MGQEAFINLRGSLSLYPDYDAKVAVVDHLWSCRYLLEHFFRNAATFVVQVGVSSLDENTVRCEGRNSARLYMKSKPIKIGIRLYAVVGWSHAYLHSIQDNGSGNITGLSLVQRYTKVFRTLPSDVERKIDRGLVSKSSASVLWCAQMSHQTQLHSCKQGQLMVMNNLYTRHVLAKQLATINDQE